MRLIVSDTFATGYLYSYIQEWDHYKSIRIGNAWRSLFHYSTELAQISAQHSKISINSSTKKIDF